MPHLIKTIQNELGFLKRCNGLKKKHKLFCPTCEVCLGHTAKQTGEPEATCIYSCLVKVIFTAQRQILHWKDHALPHWFEELWEELRLTQEVRYVGGLIGGGGPASLDPDMQFCVWLISDSDERSHVWRLKKTAEKEKTQKKLELKMYFYIVKIFDKHERAELNSTD